MSRQTTDINLVEHIYSQFVALDQTPGRNPQKVLDIMDYLDKARKEHRAEYRIAKRWHGRIIRKGQKGHGR